MLPPYFTITPKITKHIEAIGAIFGYLRAIQLPAGYRRELVSKVTTETVHSSTAIEGNTLTEQQVADVLHGKPVHAQPIDIQEILNYDLALSFVERTVQEPDFTVTEQTIREINALVLKGIRDDIAGRYRIKQVIVGDYLPPEHFKVPAMMDDFVTWINQPTPADLSPILYTGIAHYQLVAIHPFEDGNGRTTRILTSLLLLRHGYSVTSLFALESYYNRDRRAYYQALSSADQYRVAGKPDLTRWLEYYTEGMLIEAERARSRIDEQIYRQSIVNRTVSLREHQKRLLMYIAEQGSAQTGDYLQLSKLSRKGAYNAMRQMVKLGLLNRSGAGKGAYYTLTDKGVDYVTALQ